MRVIAGRYKGRRLGPVRGRDVRPTSDRVREALFSILGDIEGASVLDAFAGTGALGVEAVSRGASSLVLVEIDRRAAEMVRRNVHATVSGDDDLAPTVRIVHADIAKAIGQFSTDSQRFDLIFIDPPYEKTEEHIRGLSEALPSLFNGRTTVVLEVATRHSGLVDMAAETWGLESMGVRRYGDTAIGILKQPTPGLHLLAKIEEEKTQV